MIHILRSRVTPEQMKQMLESLGIYLKSVFVNKYYKE